MLSYETLDVYKMAIKFFARCVKIIGESPKGHADVLDQLKRASLSILANTAEGAGKTGKLDKKRFYSIARGSAMECGAILDASVILKITDQKVAEDAKTDLIRVVSMLSRMCR